MERKEQEITELKPEELGQASGGTLDRNRYRDPEYAAAGIRCVSHLIIKDEFWWNGRDIGHDNANAVVLYCRNNGKQPGSLEEALNYSRNLNDRKKEPEHHGCDLTHLA